jgi:hypothetical protein
VRVETLGDPPRTAFGTHGRSGGASATSQPPPPRPLGRSDRGLVRLLRDERRAPTGTGVRENLVALGVGDVEKHRTGVRRIHRDSFGRDRVRHGLTVLVRRRPGHRDDDLSLPASAALDRTLPFGYLRPGRQAASDLGKRSDPTTAVPGSHPCVRAAGCWGSHLPGRKGQRWWTRPWRRLPPGRCVRVAGCWERQWHGRKDAAADGHRTGHNGLSHRSQRAIAFRR